jgi:hypothetical protein
MRLESGEREAEVKVRQLRVVRRAPVCGGSRWTVTPHRIHRPIEYDWCAALRRVPVTPLEPQQPAAAHECALDPDGGCPESDSPREAFARQIHAAQRSHLVVVRG